MSKLLNKANSIGADFALIVSDNKNHLGYTRFYKLGSWEVSRNCLLFWDENRRRWNNSSELGFHQIKYGLTVTGRNFTLVDFIKKEKEKG